MTVESLQECMKHLEPRPEVVEWTIHPDVAKDPVAIAYLIEEGCLPRAVLEKGK